MRRRFYGPNASTTADAMLSGLSGRSWGSLGTTFAALGGPLGAILEAIDQKKGGPIGVPLSELSE